MFGLNRIGNFLKSTAESQVTDEVTTKVNDLCKEKFHGNLKQAFDHYAKDGGIDKSTMKTILGDAGVSTAFASTDQIASACVDRFDTGHTGKVSWQEFSAAIPK